MKTNKNLSIFLPLVVAMVTLVGCSDYDNGFTEKEIQFNVDFTEQFGSFDETQDWNLAERANVTVTTSEVRDVNVYTEKDGQYVQVGAFKNVSGTKKLEFDVIESMQNLVVSNGYVGLRAVVGGTVNFDDMTSVGAEALGTRGIEYMDRNLWSKEYVVPANITEAEWNAVVAEFSKQHYGAYNEVLVPWTDMFVQQVYKGEASYVDAFNQNTNTASDKMNRLMVWDKSASEWSQQYDNSYIHVNDFNAGNQTTEAYDDDDTEHANPIIGMTLMLGLDPTDCPTEEVKVKNAQGSEVTKNWVKQFCYHNSQSSEYKATYIMKRVTWVENGVEKSGLYLGFDFMADKPTDQTANLNMDVTRDWIFNDWIIKVSQALDVMVPVEELQDAKPQTWVLAGEDLGGGFDIDYNDGVVKVERLAGSQYAYVTPLAAGGTQASYLFFGQTCIGEIHQLLGASPARSGSYGIINMDGDIQLPSTKVEVNVGRDWYLDSEDLSEANNMGGFTIRVLPAGTEPMARVLDYDDGAFDKATNVNAPVLGKAPYILCVPFTYTLVNSPEEGLKTTNVWAWPTELTTICDDNGVGPYPNFKEWARNKANSADWYMHPDEHYIVSTQRIAMSYAGYQPQSMEESEQVITSNPNYNTSFYNDVLPSVYPEVVAPVAYLRLKENVDGVINVKTGDVIDVFDYVDVTPDYRKSVFTVEAPDIMALVEGSNTKLECVQTNPGTTTVNVKLATPTTVLNVDLTVHYNGGAPTETPQKESPNLGVNSYTPTLYVGDTETITISSNSSATISVSSDDANVATVTKNGNTLTITGVAVGNTNIRVHQDANDTYNAADADIYVTVKGQETLEWNLGKSAVTLDTETAETIAMGINDNGNYTGTPTFTTSNAQVATVSEHSKESFTVNAVGAGTATITINLPATSAYKAASKTVTVTVNRKTPIFKISQDAYNYWSDNASTAISTTLLPNGTYQIHLYGFNTDTRTTIQYASNNTSVATVDNNGLITAHGGGTAIITVTSPQTDVYNSATATVTVTVGKKPSTLTVKNQTVTWTKNKPYDMSSNLDHSTGGALTYNQYYYDGTEQVSAGYYTNGMNGNILTPGLKGTHTISITQAETAEYEGKTVTYTLIVTEDQTTGGNSDFGTEIRLSNGKLGSQSYSEDRTDVIDLSSLPKGTYQITQVFPQGTAFNGTPRIYLLTSDGTYLDINNGNTNTNGTLVTSSDTNPYTKFDVNTNQYQYFIINYHSDLWSSNSPEATYVKPVNSSAKRRIIRK